MFRPAELPLINRKILKSAYKMDMAIRAG